nr:TonB-dependent receptor [Noviherbaspirillum massiliense]
MKKQNTAIPVAPGRMARLLLLPVMIAGSVCHAQTAPANTNEGADARTLEPVVVTATRIGQPGFDLPLSIDVIGAETIQQNNPMVNLSEPLVRVPGVVVQNRQNYAQDLQVSSRGFGARSTFGVRGVRLYADGIPATMPDGQGQTSHFDLSSAERIEVLRGPFSALYGNSSGGVISVFTENGKPGLALSPYVQFGSYGTRHYGFKVSGQQGNINHVEDVARFDSDGYREHSAVRRDRANVKLRITPDADSSLTMVANAVRMVDVQDPLGLSRAQFEADPRAADPNALAFNTRKSVRQHQFGLNYERILDAANSVTAVLYGGERSTLQYQAIPVAAQTAPTSAGGVIDLARQYGGLDLRWTYQGTWAGRPLQWTAGISYDDLNEDRRGFENFVDGQLGVKGRLRRNEDNRAWNFDQYLQAQWEPAARWLLLAGVRNSSVHISSDDHYIAPGNGDDSGSAGYHALNPVLGATYRLNREVNLYASYGKGFETPTLNELSYRPGAPAAAGFNFGLKPARSENVEVGVKARIASRVRASLAVFHIDTEDELVVLSNTGGRAVFQNAGKTRRDGIELLVDGNWNNGIGTLLSYSLLRAVYADPFCSGPCSASTQVPSGNRIPGVPRQTAYGELSWRHPASGFSTALEGKYVGKVYVDDVNSDAASAYFTANLRFGLEQQAGRWQLREFARIDNLADRQYIGSVIVNEGNRRFFEPAPGRNYTVGVTASYGW